MYERFLEHNTDALRQPVDAAETAAYAGRVPASLLTLWEEAGRGTFCGGMVRLINPADYQDFVDEYFHPAYAESVVPFMVTAFGDLFACVRSRVIGDHLVFLNIRYGTFQILPNRPEVLLNFHLFDKRHYYALDRYAEISAITGIPQPGECLGYVPALALDGTEDDGNLRRVELLPYLRSITEAIGEFEPEDFSGRYPWLGPDRVPKTKRCAPPTDALVNDTLTAIARDISGNEPAVMQAIQLCTTDIAAWCREHAGQYDNRATNPAQSDPLHLKWLALADILLNEGYARELDWKCELDDLRLALHEICPKNPEAACLAEVLDNAPLDEDDDLTVWCAALSEACPGHVLGCIGIDSDSYVIFPAQKNTLATLQQTARRIGQCIAPVEDS